MFETIDISGRTLVLFMNQENFKYFYLWSNKITYTFGVNFKTIRVSRVTLQLSIYLGFHFKFYLQDNVQMFYIM